MARNKVFLLLPLIASGETLEEVYLKVVPEWPEEKVCDLCSQMKQAQSFNDHESYDKIFDQKQYHNVRSLIQNLEKTKRTVPSIVNLLDSTFRSFIDFHNDKELDCESAILVNKVKISDSLANAYVHAPFKDSVVLADCDALCVSKDALDIADENGTKLNVDVINFKDKDLYRWFVIHRNPVRTYDSNYKKHGKQDQWSKKGVLISKMTYKASEAQVFLHKAVGAKGDKKNLFFLDKSRNTILVFWDEGLTLPKYHGYEVPYDNAVIQKIYAKGSTQLKKKIDTAADWE